VRAHGGIHRVHGCVVHHTFGVITGLVVPVIHVLLSIFGHKDVDGRDKPGHDELEDRRYRTTPHLTPSSSHP
jgi:hypothetical protein